MCWNHLSCQSFACVLTFSLLVIGRYGLHIIDHTFYIVSCIPHIWCCSLPGLGWCMPYLRLSIWLGWYIEQGIGVFPAVLCSNFQAYVNFVFDIGHLCFGYVMWWCFGDSIITIATIVAAAVADATAVVAHIIVLLGWPLELGSDQFLGPAVARIVLVSDVLLYCNVVRV